MSKPLRGSVRITDTNCEVVIKLPLAAVEAAGAIPAAPQLARSHAPDFASIVWDGEVYTFTPKQRLVVAVLWAAMVDGTLYRTARTLLTAADSSGSRIASLFGKHPAWGLVIVQGPLTGGPRGTYRLAA